MTDNLKETEKKDVIKQNVTEPIKGLWEKKYQTAFLIFLLFFTAMQSYKMGHNDGMINQCSELGGIRVVTQTYDMMCMKEETVEYYLDQQNKIPKPVFNDSYEFENLKLEGDVI